MKTRWKWGLILLLGGCLESNPQPSPGQSDTGRWTAADIAEPGGLDALVHEGDAVPAPGQDVGAQDVTPADSVCIPNCENQACGDDDGCGDLCQCAETGGTCWPCSAADDCLADHQCHGGGEGGCFCYMEAAGDEDCPDGTWWHDNTGLCLSIGDCKCSAEAVAAGAKGTCTKTNDYGTCSGFVVCTVAGALPDKCDAPEPTAELCNGIDDDCDGDIDEDCGQCFDFVCAEVLCTEDCEQPECAIDCCDGSCFLCPEGGVCVGGECCMPDCAGKQCGPDGCGGSCGNCPAWHECDIGQCVVDNPCGVQFEGLVGCGCSCDECTCETDPYCCDHPWDANCITTCTTLCGGCEPCTGECFDKDCGSDGCGGSCGSCPPATPYCINGMCEADCQTDCAGKTCGPDGCGGSCGTCPDLEVIPDYSTMIQACGPDGQCHCARCDYVLFDEPWSCEGDCDIDFCMPSCDGKECGDDGCGGICGQCGWGAECAPDGHCVCALP